MQKDFIFTSESVSEGHPDKMADQISDAILDEILKKDVNSYVACETYLKTGMVVVGGEVTTKAWIDIEHLVRKLIVDIGYNDARIGFDGNSCAVINVIGKQSPEIADGIQESSEKEQGAGDQGLMFGYACNETDVLMPAPINYSHRILKKHSELRRSKKLDWLKPDAKTQVTFEYKDGKPHRVSAIVLSTQHSKNIDSSNIKEAVIEEIIKPVIPSEWLKDTLYHINPSGSFIIGGPMGDCGLTGRKIIVDTYGGMSRHGGGAFSGKDPSKVDRSAAYMCRYMAKNIVKAGLADKCEIQISYAIGVAEPTSININCFDTETKPIEKIIDAVKKTFKLKPAEIIKELDLLRPIYLPTSTYGHFGREEDSFTWEKTNKTEELLANI